MADVFQELDALNRAYDGLLAEIDAIRIEARETRTRWGNGTRLAVQQRDEALERIAKRAEDAIAKVGPR